MSKKMEVLYWLLAVVVLTGALVCSMGAVRVDVRSKTAGGKHICVIAPATVLPVGAMLVPRAKLREASRQVQPWLPTIQAATEALSRCADAILVQVDNRHEHVKIAKVGGALVVDVDDEGETVHVSVPMRAAAYACNRLAEEVRNQPEATDRPAI